MITVRIEINGQLQAKFDAVNTQPNCGAWPCACIHQPHEYSCGIETLAGGVLIPYKLEHVRADGMYRLAMAMIRAGVLALPLTE